MIRRLLNLLTALSLLLCVLTVVLWARSYFVRDAVEFMVGRRAGGAASAGGQLVVSVRKYDLDLGRRLNWNRDGFHDPDVGSRKSALANFTWGFDSAARESIVVTPIWPLAALAAIFPAIALYHRRRRRKPGVCSRCGYDLRATPDRCPECGTPAAVGRRRDCAPSHRVTNCFAHSASSGARGGSGGAS